MSRWLFDHFAPRKKEADECHNHDNSTSTFAQRRSSYALLIAHISSCIIAFIHGLGQVEASHSSLFLCRTLTLLLCWFGRLNLARVGGPCVHQRCSSLSHPTLRPPTFLHVFLHLSWLCEGRLHQLIRAGDLIVRPILTCIVRDLVPQAQVRVRGIARLHLNQPASLKASPQIPAILATPPLLGIQARKEHVVAVVRHRRVHRLVELLHGLTSTALPHHRLPTGENPPFHQRNVAGSEVHLHRVNIHAKLGAKAA